MRVCLVGADFEENLALGILAGVVEQAGHEPLVVPLNSPDEAAARVEQVLDARPEVVGLSIQFQHRADEFLAFARALRDAGYGGHITAGGHFPTMAFAEALEGDHGLDSVVLYDGEQTLAALLGALDAGEPLSEVAGLALRAEQGRAFRTAPRRLIDELDEVPFAKRYRPHTRHFGIPFIPILGGRGCWGDCAFCSIQTVYRDARSHGGGRLLRHRSVDDIASEMALLWHDAGGDSIFCFHDDNFLLPRPADSLARLRALRRRLDEYGVEEIGIVGKCRPETLTPQLAEQLAELGVIRLYVGVENASLGGAAHLGRATQQRAVRTALEACRQAGIFTCYNLLIFEPDATLADVRDNLTFMREHADRPINFCRAEPYVGTPLSRLVEQRQAARGEELGWNYRIADDRTELLHRICATVFDERNFAPDGVANRYMGLGYAAKVLEHFHGASRKTVGFRRRAEQLTREITFDTADYLERCVELAERADLAHWDAIERRTALLGMEVAAADRIWHRELDELFESMEVFAAQPELSKPPPRPTERFLTLKRSAALGLSLAVVFMGCEDETGGGGGGHGNVFVDSPPGGFGGTAVDPLPGGHGGTGGDLNPGGHGGVGGAAGAAGAGGDSGGGTGAFGGGVADPPPGGFGGSAALERPLEGTEVALPAATVRHALIDQWRSSGPQRSIRSRDLPLFDPPRVKLTARRDGDVVAVTLDGAPEAIVTRWQADGPVVAAQRTCEWRPLSPRERLRVAVRSYGGIAIATIGADEAV